VNTGVPLAEVMRETRRGAPTSLDEVASLFTAFVARKRSLGLLDFDDLLLYWRVAAQDEAVGRELGAVYDHILVDEFQDVNLLQLDVLVGLRRIDTRLTIVGDDAQAIYGFRGATARFLLDAEHYFSGLTTITWTINYRSSARS
jgi:DNA helicase II / ATP-dependent DNA helicase PcrA